MSTLTATVHNWPSSQTTTIDWDNAFTTYKEKEQEIKVELDLLVLSATLYRLRNSKYGDEQIANQYRCLSLIDDNIQQYVTESDYEFAEEIRNHFSQKLMMLQLKSDSLTAFRQDMSNFLHSEWHRDPAGVFIYPKKFLGLAYKLPYFYMYDIELAKIFGSSYSSVKGPERLKGVKKLNFVNKIEPHTRRSSANIEYWFEDETDNKVMISLEKHNPLLSIFDKMVEGPITLDGKFELRRKDNLQYYNAPLWKCVV